MTLSNTGTVVSTGRSWKKRFGIALSAIFAVAICVAIRYFGGGPETTSAAQPQDTQLKQIQSNQMPIRTASVPKQTAGGTTTSTPTKSAQSQETKKATPPEIVAEVNGRKITREELAQECLAQFGKEIIEHLINKQLIIDECNRHNITVTSAEVDAEIERMATRFGIPVDQWLKLLKQERKITPDQYADDIIWPTLALRKLAGDRLRVSKEELTREFEIHYGPAVQARLISCKDEAKAKGLHDMVVADPENFGNIARDKSEDIASAAAKGLIQPIRMHGSYEGIEKAAFSMKDGEISQVISAGGQYVIIKREGLIPARDKKIEEVAGQLEEIIRERKLRKVANDVFGELQKKAKIENTWNDAEKQKRYPGVAAIVNGEQITIRRLALECIDRHGTEILEGVISHALLEVECKKRDVKVSDTDMNAEIARAAALGIKPKADGSPDVAAWLEQVTKEQDISMDSYRRNAVWPSAALRKLAGEKVDVTDDDLQKGFEANYGQKVRCLAIVLNNQRRAQEVFEKARKNNTSENFGELAAQYSIEPGSSALNGEVPPIRKWGGQPLLEKEAFALKQGEISGIIQVGDKFILLRCEGFINANSNAKFADVREEIYKDLYEKKLRAKMGEFFENLQESARIRNYLTGEAQNPKESPKERQKEMSRVPEDLKLPTVKQVPTKRG